MQTTQISSSDKPTLQLEERQCAGCSKTFRVLVQSPQAFCSHLCQTDSGVKDPKPIKIKPWASLERDRLLYGKGQRTKPEVQQSLPIIEADPEPEPTIYPPLTPIDHSPPVLEIDEKTDRPLSEGEITERWDKYVQHARTYVKTMNKCRMAVAELALSACDVSWGGGNHWKKFEGVYTLKRFAEEIGMHPKTLGEWCAIKKLVHDKLPEGVYDETNYMAAHRTRVKISRESDPAEVQKVYDQETNRDGDAYYFYQAAKRLKTTRHLVCKRVKLEDLNREEISEMRDLAGEIHQKLSDFLTRTSS